MENDDARKKVIEIISADVTILDNDKAVIKAIGSLVPIYVKKYDDVKVEVSNKSTDGVIRQYVSLVGVVAETDAERDFRLGVGKDDSSWIKGYSDLLGCTKKEAKENMEKMISEGQMLSPKEWFEYKKNKLSDFFNVK